jgi:SAM-dependent methyltransferase
MEPERTWLASMADAYDRHLGPAVFGPYAADLAARAVTHAPRRVLELAAGTGEVTRALAAALPEAALTATDLNRAMVELGSQRVPSAHWQVADALDLPFSAGTYELVACQFGVMFFPDKVAGLREATRVLVPDGNLLVSTWAGIETHAFAAALASALERVLPHDPPTFVAAIPHGYADPELFASDIARAGLEDISVESVTLMGSAPSAAELALGFCTGTPLRAQLAARGDVDELTDRVAAQMGAELGPGPVTGTMTAYVAQARKPS